jgi:hypothetical protein
MGRSGDFVSGVSGSLRVDIKRLGFGGTSDGVGLFAF